MTLCSHKKLDALYPQIWNWGIVWQCKDCGEFFFCDCFRPYLEDFLDRLAKPQEKIYSTPAVQIASLFPPEYTNYLVGREVARRVFHGEQPMTELNDRHKGDHSWVNDILIESPFKYLQSICHVCAKTASDQFFCASVYGSRFFQNFGAWVHRDLFMWGIGRMPREPERLPAHIRKKYFEGIEIPRMGYTKEYRNAVRLLEHDLEDEIRRQLDYPQIGEYWKSETKLYKLIKKLFPNRNVIHHYFPPFLNGQELDIYVEGLRLGIEYQGRQHFEPIDFFGGEEGFLLTQERDKRKQELCKKNRVRLEYFSYSEPLTKEYVSSKFAKYMKT